MRYRWLIMCDFTKLWTHSMREFDLFGVIANSSALLASFAPLLLFMIVDALILLKNLKIDPFYLTFSYFCPPGSEYYERWYSRSLHAVLVTVLGLPCIMEGVHIFNFNIINDILIPLKVQKYLKLGEAAVSESLPSLSVVDKIERGLKLYDSICIIQLRGLDSTTFDCLMILGLG